MKDGKPCFAVECKAGESGLNPAIHLLCMAAPITSRVRGHGFEVPVNGKKVKGVVLCQQVKMIDFTERGLQFVEKALEVAISDVLARVRAIVSEE